MLDGRNALLAVAMNGEALPVVHGFPVRMVVPGLYGYVSATKWVTDIEATTFAAARAYWVQQGWAQQAPIKTESRIDVPADGASFAPGRIAVAGVAWAQHKGIAAVEVRLNGGSWHEGHVWPWSRHRHLAAVGVGMAGHTRQLSDRSPRHRPDRHTQTGLRSRRSQCAPATPPPRSLSAAPELSVGGGEALAAVLGLLDLIEQSHGVILRGDGLTGGESPALR